MKNASIYLLCLFVLIISACADDDFVIIPDFNFPKTVTFEQNLSAYNIFQNTPSDLIPADDYHLLDLVSVLYTDYAYKQRLVKVPAGMQMNRLSNGSIDFPDGTILTKSFFYYHDERDTSLGKRIIETRLMIKADEEWNVATYVWNENQTDATLELTGTDTQVSWTNLDGNTVSTLYHVPDENECSACHQSNLSLIPLGTKLRNLNRTVERNNTTVNQISHLQTIGILNNFQLSQVSTIVNYKDNAATLVERGRAYLDLNCSHCHQPDGWDEPAGQGFDFRYETALNQTGILDDGNEIIEMVESGEMPLLGTTINHEEGISLVVEFIESL